MKNRLVFVTCFFVIFISMTTISEWTFSVNAQTNTGENDSNSGLKITTRENISAIITPWNTGNVMNINDTAR